MSKSIDRREFLSRGLRAAAGIAVVGSAPEVLAACGSSGSTGAASKAASQVGVSNARPRRGGRLTVGITSETDGLNPVTSRWAPSGIQYAMTVFDPLAVVGTDGKIHPYLAEAITPNATYDRWTITLRPNVAFHDGEPLDAAAVAKFFNAYVHGALSGPAFNQISTANAVNRNEVLVVTKEPWIAFPVYLSSQLGYVPSPRQLDSADSSTKPIGTGPFVLQEWMRNDHLTATRNPHYWRPGMPYLDEITYRPIVDGPAQQASLESGTIDLLVTNDTSVMAHVRGDSSVAYVDNSKVITGEPNINMILLNTQQPPVDDIRVRRGLAYATDVTKLRQIAYNGLGRPMNGPFLPGSPYYGPTGFPTYDLDKARSLISAYRRDKGTVSLTYLGTPSPQDERQAQLLQTMWASAGVNVSLKTVDSSTQINDVLLGKYQASSFANYAAADPDANFIFWDSKYVAPPGTLAVNFSRLADPVIDAALKTGRTNPDTAARVAAYMTVARQLAKEVPQLWLTQNVVAAAARHGVMNFADPMAPSGAKVSPLGSAVPGEVWPTQIWRSA